MKKKLLSLALASLMLGGALHAMNDDDLNQAYAQAYLLNTAKDNVCRQVQDIFNQPIIIENQEYRTQLLYHLDSSTVQQSIQTQTPMSLDIRMRPANNPGSHFTVSIQCPPPVTQPLYMDGNHVIYHRTPDYTQRVHDILKTALDVHQALENLKNAAQE